MLHPNEKRWIYLRKDGRAVLAVSTDDESRYGEKDVDYAYQPWPAPEVDPDAAPPHCLGCDAMREKLQELEKRFDAAWKQQKDTVAAQLAAITAERDALAEELSAAAKTKKAKP